MNPPILSKGEHDDKRLSNNDGDIGCIGLWSVRHDGVIEG
jgi:hypothetical protein